MCVCIIIIITQSSKSRSRVDAAAAAAASASGTEAGRGDYSDAVPRTMALLLGRRLLLLVPALLPI